MVLLTDKAQTQLNTMLSSLYSTFSAKWCHMQNVKAWIYWLSGYMPITEETNRKRWKCNIAQKEEWDSKTVKICNIIKSKTIWSNGQVI